MKIMFVDAKSDAPYDGDHLLLKGVSGTEATLVQEAEGCATHHDVVVAQRGRQVSTPVRGVRYAPLSEEAFGANPPDRIVILRKHKLTAVYRRRYSRARIYSWIHNWQRPEVLLQRALLARADATVIAVSDALRASTDRQINSLGARAISLLAGVPAPVPVRRIYNHIADELQPDHAPVNLDQMISLAPAYKGLQQVLTNFIAVRQRQPAMELLVAGADAQDLRHYSAAWAPLLEQPSIHFLGRLPQNEMLNYVRRSLCVFYPQSLYPKTFGLIFAEANAVGTPVLAHDFGSAREVLGGDDQLVDATDPEAVASRIAAWRESGRPQVAARSEFRRQTVLREWLRLFDQPRLQT